MLTFFSFILFSIMSWPGYWIVSLILGLSFFCITFYKFLEETFNKFIESRVYFSVDEKNAPPEDFVKIYLYYNKKFPNIFSLFLDRKMFQIFFENKKSQLLGTFFLSLGISLIGLFWNISLMFCAIAAAIIIAYIVLHVTFSTIVFIICKIFRIERPAWGRYPWETNLKI